MSEDIRLVKRNLREDIKKYRIQLDPQSKKQMDDSITSLFLHSTSYSKSDVILTYVSTAIEVSTEKIILTALEEGKKVACPRCIDDTREMEFYYIGSLDDLTPRTFGVREPPEDRNRMYDGGGRPVCIVPGLSFDNWGYRLGYGKGYYDRFLSRYSGWTVGLCYSACVQYKLPHGRFDRPVDRLITEKYLRLCDDGRNKAKRKTL
jgi:5,10-methenyltetrahydrofolate synthetase